jgi:predicted Zn-dependent protease
MLPTRLITTVVAALVAAWFVIGARQAHEVAAATPTVVKGSAAGQRQLTRAGSELSSAEFLNPDRAVTVLRARLAIAEGHLGRAQRTLTQVTRSEPLNLNAWLWLYSSYFREPRQQARAFRHLAALDPIDTR